MRVTILERIFRRSLLFFSPQGAMKIFLALILFGFAAAPWNIIAAEPDIKLGEVITSQNWQKIQGMVGENFLNRVKAGHKLQIKEPKVYRPLKEYVEATEKYSGKVGLGPNGELLNYVAGQPFPKIDPSDPQIGQKLAWNFFYRWLGDDYKTGGAVKGGKIIGASGERKIALSDPTAHAEILAIRQAAEQAGDWRLEECALYATLEPCPMCAGAALLARIPLLVYGAANAKFGAVATHVPLLEYPKWNHEVRVVSGVLAEECGAVLSEFFAKKRMEGRE